MRRRRPAERGAGGECAVGDGDGDGIGPHGRRRGQMVGQRALKAQGDPRSHCWPGYSGFGRSTTLAGGPERPHLHHHAAAPDPF